MFDDTIYMSVLSGKSVGTFLKRLNYMAGNLWFRQFSCYNKYTKNIILLIIRIKLKIVSIFNIKI